MSEEDSRLRHLRPRKDPDEALIDRITDSIDLRMSKHFQEQTHILKQQNELLKTSVQRLIEEVDGVRTGRALEAFAKVAPVN